jgi:beta-phosphoglucomutase-like phosphatase (HAD superfamily)
MIKLRDFKALILDMDGVVADTEPIFFDAFQILLGEHDITLSQEYLFSLVGHSTKKNIEDISADFKLKMDVDASLRQLDETYLRLLQAKSIAATDGIWRLIRESKKNGMKLGLCTSSSRTQTDTLLRQIWLSDQPPYRGPHEVLDAVLTGDDVSKKKPDAEPYVKITGQLKVQPSECLVIEDSVSGIRSAKSAGCICVALRTPYNRELDLSLADRVIDRLEDLI